MAKKGLLLTLLFFSFCGFASADTFRVRRANLVTLEAAPKAEVQVTCGVTDAIAITMPEDKIFLEGIELRITIPEEIASFRDSVAVSVYDKISPQPSKSQIDYTGTRIYVHTLPGRLSWNMQIPLCSPNSIKDSQYSTTIDSIPNLAQNMIFIRFQPVMKGIPDETLKSQINVSIRPILKNSGRIILNLKSQDEEMKPVSLYVDDVMAGLKDDLIVSTGIHNISIVSDSYRNEVRTIYVDQAKNTSVDIELKGVEPTLFIEAPAGTKVFLDGDECNVLGKEFIITEGEHTVKCQVGDYEVMRTINAEKGKSYKANFQVNLTISNDEESF